MPHDRLDAILDRDVAALERAGTAKGDEAVVVEVRRPSPGRGPRVLLRGQGEREFIRMNSNSYLGMSLRPEVIDAEESAARRFGAGPGAVRFISGSYEPHLELEGKLAAFHARPAAMIFSSAYASVVSTLVPLIDNGTLVISDELNHNCIINAMRLARPLGKRIYAHNDMDALAGALEDAASTAAEERPRRVLVVTDGIFSMRGDHAPLDRIVDLARKYDEAFDENVLVVVDDSHGVGAIGEAGRGTEEYCGAQADVLVATLGKALGVNGGYVVASESIIGYLRESSMMYIYSNPITPGEAQAASAALDLLDGGEGAALLTHLRDLTRRFENGLVERGFEVIEGEHPVVPLMVRDTDRTRSLVAHLFDSGVLATGLTYPVVPRGDEEIRFQINADHTEADVDEVLAVLAAFSEG
ncbi:MAG: aminotransferase class I/II-fold pyridoxal phosphate-dependent enzyme [Gemmatimonadota bacterium]